MQGTNAAREVIEALRRLDPDPEVDVIVIARGGGSIEDLLPFSDEALIRAVAGCPDPGRQRDRPRARHARPRPTSPTSARPRPPTPPSSSCPTSPRSRQRITQAARPGARASCGSWLDHERPQLEPLRSATGPRATRTCLVDRADEVDATALSRARRVVRHRLDRAQDDVDHHLARVRASPRWPRCNAATPWSRTPTGTSSPASARPCRATNSTRGWPTAARRPRGPTRRDSRPSGTGR